MIAKKYMEDLIVKKKLNVKDINMKLIKPINPNYCATVTKPMSIYELDNCDNVNGAMVCGYNVIVPKSYTKDTIGIFFPVETKISHNFLHNNNMYRHSELNKDEKKKGFFDNNGRVRCQKFRGNKSEGIFLPLNYLDYLDIDTNLLKINDEFDFLDGEEICKKYIVKTKKQTSIKNKGKQPKNISRLIPNQFRLHIDTTQLGKNIHLLQLDDYISITKKMHGTSAVFSNLMVKKKLNIIEKILKTVGINIVDFEYDIIYSSRKVVKNGYLNKNNNHFYNTDVWGEIKDKIKDKIPECFSLYGEIVGYDNTNHIQKGFHYGEKIKEKEFYVYRITITNFNGNVFELDRKQIEEFCKIYDLNSTPLYYYGSVLDLCKKYNINYNNENWKIDLLNKLKADSDINMNDVMCEMNNYEVPAEGIVLRVENLFNPKPYKLKNNEFLDYEGKLIDKGEENIEDIN